VTAGLGVKRLMAFRVTASGRVYEADTSVEFAALYAQLNVAPAVVQQVRSTWTATQAREFLNRLPTRAAAAIRELSAAPSNTITATALAARSRQSPSSFSSLFAIVGHIARVSGVACPVQTTRTGLGFVYTLDIAFAAALNTVAG
jgi:hypothetical protein